MAIYSFLTSLLVFGLASASVLPDQPLVAQRATATTSSTLSCPTGNGPNSRACWDEGLTVYTDAEVMGNWPQAAGERTYALNITTQLMHPDGMPKQMMVINGQYPGPVIYAKWGQLLHIDVTNSVPNEGTSIHWHGINQVNSSISDGANGVTECPIPYGATRRYTFTATQHGTTWYHSHHSGQYGDGVVGTMVIDGPSIANYDVDLGTLPISDLYYKTMLAEGKLAKTSGPPTPNNGVINGTNNNPTANNGTNWLVNLQPNTTYRLRLVNTAVDNHFRVSLDSHIFSVIQADFVPITSYNTTWLSIGIGERYDVVFTTNQKADNYWFRAEVQSCSSSSNGKNILAIFRYAGAANAVPTSTSKVTYTSNCIDETTLAPLVPKPVPSGDFNFTASDNLTIALNGNTATWTVGADTIAVNWSRPTLEYIYENSTAYRNNPNLNIFELPDANKWVFWVVQNNFGFPHPIHLHGHDFYLLGVSTSATKSSSSSRKIYDNNNLSDLNFVNPTRRDVAMVPANGWLVISFFTDNPGAWLMHCHIGWHISQGLGVQFLEQASEIPNRMDLSQIQSQCDAWDAYYAKNLDPEIDSGL